MTAEIIIDTGPLVALLSCHEQMHTWCVKAIENSYTPFLTCDSVITEAFFLLSSTHAGTDALWDLLNRDLLRLAFSLEQERQSVQALMKVYQNVPMSLADACLVRMSELNPKAMILTLDSDFQIYRKNRNQVISCLAPWSE